MPSDSGRISPLASIVVGTDFTPCSAIAIAQAIRIARSQGSALHVVHFIDSSVVGELESAISSVQPDIRTNLIHDTQLRWTQFAQQIPGAQDLPLHIAIDNRITGILKQASQVNADLLILGAFGHRRPDVGFGTIATGCVRTSATDVLLVRDTQSGPFKNIVAAIDFSDTSSRVLARAAMLAHQDAAELHLLHVFSAPWHELHYRAPTPLAAPHLQVQYRKALDGRLLDFGRKVIDAYPNLRLSTVCFDNPQHRSGIIEYAQRVSADLIVLGTRGHSNLHDFLLGTTAEKVLQESPFSIFAVKPEHHAR